MDIKMRYKYLGLIALMLASSIFAAEVTVYRWVDEKDIVHFSQNQPAHDNYTELTMTEAYHPPVPDEKESAGEDSDTLLASTEGLTENSLAKCNEAKANVRTLSAFDKIQYTDSDGVTKVLSKLEKEQQLEISKKQVEVYCKVQ